MSESITGTPPNTPATHSVTSAQREDAGPLLPPTRAHLTQNPQSTLDEHATALIGVARWPDGRYNNEAHPHQQAYGKNFSAESVKLGAQISSGQIESLEALWVQCRLWRAKTAYLAKENDASAFARSRENDPIQRSTSILGRYAFLHQDVADAAHVSGGHTTKLHPKDGSAYRVGTVQFTVAVRGRTIPLTQMFANSKNGKPVAVPDAVPERGETIGTMLHTDPRHLPALMARAEELFQTTLDAQTPQEKLKGLAELHWLLAHAMPDERGSAAKSELAIRSMAHAMGMELPPCSRGSCPDLQAFVCSKDEFIENYKELFEGPSDVRQREHERDAASA